MPKVTAGLIEAGVMEVGFIPDLATKRVIDWILSFFLFFLV